MLESGVLEPYLVKHWGIKLATNAAITVLRVDQVCTQILLICHFMENHPQRNDLHAQQNAFLDKGGKSLTAHLHP